MKSFAFLSVVIVVCAGCGVTPAPEFCGICAPDQACVAGACVTVIADAGQPAKPRCEATAVPCQDQSIMQLRLYDVVNPDGVTEEGTAPFFKSKIDARAGGASPTTSYLYLAFTDQGLVKKNLSDEAAFASLDWDLAVRRYVVRLNSGVGGPSCTDGARTAPNTAYSTLTQAPAGLVWRTESYFTGAACDFVPDTSGIGAPGTALSSFWTYQQCVQMTGYVYVVHLRNDRYVKLQVLSYYAPTPQATCDATGSVPTPNEAGIMRIQWAFISAPQ